MQAYASFVKTILESIFDSLEDLSGGIMQFSEGPDSGKNLSLQDSAVLRGKHAELFLNVIYENAHVFCIKSEDFPVEYSKMPPIEKRYFHSCYPKNIRRWLSGTVSRKKKCRVEFIALVTCWVIGWKVPMKQTPEYINCRRRIENICSEILNVSVSSDITECSELVKLLWDAAQKVYVEGDSEKG